jgi:Endo-alpha-N-acetylgalactosaminidase
MILIKFAFRHWSVFFWWVWMSFGGAAHAAVRSAPQQPIVLSVDGLSVVLDRADGLPYQYHLGKNHIWGEDSGIPMTAILCRMKPRSYTTVTLAPISARIGRSEVNFSFALTDHAEPAVSFNLRYSLRRSSLMLDMENVREQSGFELIEISIPDLATVREEDGPSWFAHGNEGGSVVELSHAKAYRMPENRAFGQIAFVLPVAMMGSHSLAAALEVNAFMDGMPLEIAGEPGHRHARMGTVETYRVHGGRAYDMNDLGPAIASNESTPNLLVGQMPNCHLDFFADIDGDGTVDWVDGEKLLRERMPPTPTHYFDDKLLYMIAGKYKLEKEPRTTFAQSEKLIKDIAMLTDYAPQVALVGGWANDGQDTGYPAEDRVNSSMGGYDGLMHLIDMGPRWNANVSLNTNYDDAYMSSPKWDPAIIARRPDSALWKSRDWAGESSYIVGMAKYMQGPGVGRVDDVIKRYHLHDAILVDALSWYAIRNDWDPHHPASGYKNLVEGRYKVLQEFRRRGINVLSEQLRYPYLGKLALSVDGISGDDDPFGGQPIPLVPALYRKSAIWGSGGASLTDVARNLFWNSRPGPWYNNATDRRQIAAFYFLSVLPWRQIHSLQVEGFKREGNRSILQLGGRSRLEVDLISHKYSVVVDGVEVANQDGTFCPIDNDRIAFFSRDSRQLKASLPMGWSAHQITAASLFVDHREPVSVKVKGNNIAIDVPANRPIIVYRHAQAANRHSNELEPPLN